MANPISTDLRKRIVDDFESGSTCRETAERFDVAPSTVVKVAALKQKSGSFEPLPRGGDKRSDRVEAYAEVILDLIDQQPDVTLAEIADRLLQDHGERFATSTIWRFFKRRGISYKKNRARQRAGTA